MKINKKIICIFLITALVAALFAYTAISFLNIPNKIVMLNNKIPDYGPFYSMHIAGKEGILKNGVLKDKTVLENGTYNGTMKMFGIIDVKNVDIDVETDKKLIPCGDTIGVKLYTDGVLVVGVSEFESADGKVVAPAKKAGMKTGDLIKKVNGKNVKKINEFIKAAGESEVVKIIVQRGDREMTFKIQSQTSKEDNSKKLGIWVRDSTAGIGTMTFYDPEKGTFGALGHGITDIDTGDIMPSVYGEVTNANIVAVKKGEKGIPGELQGVFINNDIGEILENTKYGIYGKLANKSIMTGKSLMEAASKDEVHEGKAYIMSNVDGQSVKKYDVEIQKIIRQNDLSTKGMVIKITDKSLIERCGGIVQGMSGSPIIQDEKIIGAVTHVFVNDPTRGYGIFIDTMLKNN